MHSTANCADQMCDLPLLRNKEPWWQKRAKCRRAAAAHERVTTKAARSVGATAADEIGTPFGVTIDFETLGEKGEELRDTVTLRDRDR